jgi:transposase InsO family protein
MGYSGRMPWKATCVINERTILISEHLRHDYSIAELARRRGVSRKTAYKWIKRYQAEPGAGLGDRSRAPLHHPNALSVELEEMILTWKAHRPVWGAPKIHSKLRDHPACPSESTVSNVLQRYGLSRQKRRRARATASAQPLSLAKGPNDVWCADFKGWFRLGNGRRCDPLTISDAASRYLLCCQGISGTTGWITVQPLFERVFREYGLPRTIRSDNGAPFASLGLGGLSPLAIWWLRLGIGLERIQPGHPEQNGRHERLHRTLKEALTIETTLSRQQRVLDEFRHDYNQDRPHEALGQQPPASVYVPSSRDFPVRLLTVTYPDGWLVRRVRHKGVIKWRGNLLYISQSLANQWIGLQPLNDGLWNVHFMSQPLGILDERKSPLRIRPLQPKHL